MIRSLSLLDRIRSAFGMKISDGGRHRIMKRWAQRTSLPLNIAHKSNYISVQPKSVTLEKTATNKRFRFRGGNTNREDQDRLRIKKGNLHESVITGGAGAQFYSKHKVTECAFLRPCERAVKLVENAQVTFENCLFYGFDPHTVLVAGNTRAEFQRCLFVDCEWVWLPMRVKHGILGPNHNVEGFFDQRGSKARFADCVFVDSGMGKVRHPDDEILYRGIERIGRYRGPDYDHLGDKRNIKRL